MYTTKEAGGRNREERNYFRSTDNRYGFRRGRITLDNLYIRNFVRERQLQSKEKLFTLTVMENMRINQQIIGGSIYLEKQKVEQ